MIIDNETNVVYFSELLKENHHFFSIESILKKHNVKFQFIQATKDIWARDYMPIQIDNGKFIQFRYEPSYLAKDLHLQSEPVEICKINGISPIFSDINLDGGNIVKWNNQVLITDRVFSENPQISNQNQLVSLIEKALEAEVIILPQVKSDFTGHADGLVRFYDGKTIIVNNLNEEYKYWGNAMKKLIQKYEFGYIDMPIFDYKAKYKGKNISAIGCYMNYLEVGNLIIFPIFELEGNKDKEAIEVISNLYPNKTIEPINVNEIAFRGGLMNCITWNIKV